MSASRRLLVLTMGVNAPPVRSQTPLRYAVADAEAIRSGFESQTHYASVRAVTLAEDTAREDILSAIADIVEGARPDDALVFFYAGHGVVEADAQARTSLYLTCGGMRADDIHATGLPLQSTVDALGRSRSHTVLVLFDCCHSGTRGSRSFLGPIAARLQREGRGWGRVTYEAPHGPGRVMLSASSRPRPAFETDELRHGFFTYALLGALAWRIDASTVALSDLYGDIKERCVQLTRGQQCPSWSGSDENAHVPRFGRNFSMR